MEVEQTNFVTQLIITVQWYYWLFQNMSVKIWSNKFQMVIAELHARAKRARGQNPIAKEIYPSQKIW